MFILTPTIKAAIAAATFFEATAWTCNTWYHVASGENCNTIIHKFHITYPQLQEWNPGKFNAQCTNLQIGTTLCVGVTNYTTATYVVQPGDTCVEIAAAHQIPETTLFANNPDVNHYCTNLYPGQVLLVGNEVQYNLD